MTTLDSFSSASASAAEDSTMEHTSVPSLPPPRPPSTNKRRHQAIVSDGGGATAAQDDGASLEEGDAEVWTILDDNFRQVQSVLDRNRVLIQQVNDNHQSKIADNMVKNVALIREINGNISKVVSLYSDLSTNFSTMYHQRNSDGEPDGYGNGNGKP